MKRGVNDSAHIEQEESIQRTRKGFKFIVKTNNVNSQLEQNNSPQESTRVERNQNLIHPENSKILEKKSKQHTKKLKASTLTENDVHNSDRHFVEPLINKCQRSDRSSKVHKQVAISKAYYPKIVNSVSSFFDVNESRSHLDLLDHFFQDICKVESLGLQLYSTQNPGREAIISVLIEFLAKLPEAVNRKLTMICDEDQVFHPELTQTEKEEQRILQTQLEILKKKSLLLDSYENNIKQFGIDYNLWIDEDISNEYIGLSREDVNVPQQQVLEISERANQLLHDIEARCDLLIEKAKSSHEIMSAAKASQDELYELYQEIRMRVTLSNNRTIIDPNNPKEIIKGLTSLLS